MIKNAGYELTNYSQDDRLAARNKLLAIVPTAPDHAPSNKPAKRTKAYFRTLADSMEDNVWRYL